MNDGPPAPLVRLSGVGLRYRRQVALDGIDLALGAGETLALIGPDGVGKSSLLSLIAGARAPQAGRIEVLGGDMARASHRRAVCPRIAYMPQGLGRNLYPTLSVLENVEFFGRLFGQPRAERDARIGALLAATGLAPFRDRPAGKLSGGMKQKLGLCCALVHDPDLLILDEPTTGVDPLSRAQFWVLIDRIRAERPAMGLLVATAYMDEAARFGRLVAMDAGRMLAQGSADALFAATATSDLEDAFVALLPEARRRGHAPVRIPPRQPDSREIAIEARGLTMRFGDFVAVDRVELSIERGEIFGFLGSNGCGKTTTMKMLTGLLAPSAGSARLFGREVDARDLATRRRVGYMSQGFSLYAELTVRQNLELHAQLFGVPPSERAARIDAMIGRFGLQEAVDALPSALPLGVRQRLSLAVALIHGPELLILDEPTSGVDPIARDAFWAQIVELSRRDRVTVFISTHFMNEAERCDRVSLMHAGRVLVTDTPAAIAARRGAATLEQAFIGLLTEAAHAGAPAPGDAPRLGDPPRPVAASRPAPRPARRFDLRRLLGYSRREALELRRDPIRAALALVGSVLLMVFMGYGISMDVEGLPFAVLDRDDSAASRDYVLSLAGSRYFIERAPIADYAELDRRMRSGELSVALEIPPGFGRDLARGRPVQLGAWIDGAMPQRAETVAAYVQAMHAGWLAERARRSPGMAGQGAGGGGTGAGGAAGGAAGAGAPIEVETRFRYNPDVRSLVAMVPAVIPLLLMMLPAILTALSVVREKELGSIVNFYVTPVTRLEFLLGKQLPYLLLALLNFGLLVLIAETVFGVPHKGSHAALAAAAVLFVASSTALGLLISTFVRSQIAAIFGTAIGTMLPAVQFSGMIEPVSSLQGAGAVIGQLYPVTHFLTVARGTFSKALGFADLGAEFAALAVSAPAILLLAVLLLRKQER